ncbi:MAG: GIY-YIG nuclease family protein, partial [Oscillospiraceae bacterium]|nr:GIY-YIG nuclease family protein [Oscillospiraceae bacterium]
MKKRGYEYGWYKKEQYIGAVYILVNPAFPNLVKIGYADDVQKRLKTLNSNSGL